jgi:hypothetical protein
MVLRKDKICLISKKNKKLGIIMNYKSEFGEKYNSFLNHFLKKEIINRNEVSKRIFLDLFKIRQAQLEFKNKFNRHIDSSLSDIFQDLIAFYLKNTLPKEYEIYLEEKKDKYRPDILIKKNKINHAIIEVKTTIGWNRELMKDKNYMLRVNELENIFTVDKSKIFYIFESYANLSKDFKKIFESRNFNGNEDLPNYFFVLFKADQRPVPYYILKKEKIKFISDEYIYNRMNNAIYNDFSEIIKKICD